VYLGWEDDFARILLQEGTAALLPALFSAHPLSMGCSQCGNFKATQELIHKQGHFSTRSHRLMFLQIFTRKMFWHWKKLLRISKLLKIRGKAYNL